MRPLVDNRGNELMPGDTVAYNLSGQVALGRVLEVHPTARGSAATRVEVRLLHDACGKKAGHVSKLRNSRNALVIEVL